MLSFQVVENLLAAWIRNFGFVDAVRGLWKFDELRDIDVVEEEWK
jgi:hypothetical protein